MTPAEEAVAKALYHHEWGWTGRTWEHERPRTWRMYQRKAQIAIRAFMKAVNDERQVPKPQYPRG